MKKLFVIIGLFIGIYCQAQTTNFNSNISISNKIRYWYDAATGEIGTQVRITNKTGGTTTKGYICKASTTTNSAFEYCAVNDGNTCFIVYEAGIADGQECWVWTIGSICEVYIGARVGTGGTNPLNNDWCRVSATGDSVTTTGMAIAETSPQNTTQHFQELGHILKARTGAGLTLLSFHTN